MTTTSLDPIALDQQHVLQVYRRAPVVFDLGRGCALFTREGERYLDLISGIGVASLGHAHPALARAIADQASTLLHTSNLFHHPLQAELAHAAVGAVRAAARVLLQQRRGSGRGLPEVRAPVLARAGRRRADGVRRVPALVPWPDDGRAVGDVGRALPRRRSQPLVPGVTFVDPPTTPAAIAAAITERHRGGHRRADPGRRRRAADPAGARPTRLRRRAAAPARCSSPTKCSAASDAPGVRSTRRALGLHAGPDGARQGARRRRADRRGDVLGPRRRGRAARATTAAPTAATCSRAARR